MFFLASRKIVIGLLGGGAVAGVGTMMPWGSSSSSQYPTQYEKKVNEEQGPLVQLSEEESLKQGRVLVEEMQKVLEGTYHDEVEVELTDVVDEHGRITDRKVFFKGPAARKVTYVSSVIPIF
ncbi:hypothetical protein MHLP_02315 [Candidatus Mycoplasma haematolamae str. Purdue]|uniref:Uncharacterized protein n=1 Tax=Mycoplasma haematolamae (strain Purdue) TaxID=1212765 RepID=I7BJK4_MYCHA|nr:hypothetical protein [Candidatus Mycoplasma haematolamae]AFO52043.1 hypothetical protein MHLP_02315 [Candidatus Mycoplasma haematolamae str. Purdue]